MTQERRQQIMELCAQAAGELREAVEGFRLDYDENGFEHIQSAMEYVKELLLLTPSTQSP